jgi:DNA-binding MarR family transcriptional regulator
MSPVKPSAAPQGCTNLKLRQLGRRVTRLYDDEQRALGLKGTQYSLLSGAIKLGPVTQSTLAAALKLEPSTLTRNLQPLVARGLLRIEPGDTGRSHHVVATDAGRALREQAQQGWKRSQLALNRRLGPERVAALHALLDECLARLEEPHDGDHATGDD